MSKGPAIWIVRKDALKLGVELQEGLRGILLPATVQGSGTNRQKFAAHFHKHSSWVLVMTTGIAVRYLQGLPKSKRSDPAVVVLDESARFAISLLSGHEGGGNELAYRVAELTGATPVITTATEALKPLVIGIGCRKGVSLAQIDAVVKKALRQSGHETGDLREVATVDRKGMEPALRRWCQKNRLPLRIISTETLVDRPWTKMPSAWVRQNLGVDGVCEPCALIASPRGRLIQSKMALNGVTVAIVADVRSYQRRKRK
jgi:cobalt-precorrin 5A hydrolase